MSTSSSFLQSVLHHPFQASAAIVGLVVLYFTGWGLYNAFLHPLRRFPGPITHRMSRLPYCIKMMQGTIHTDMLDLHDRYGDIVRIAPDELVFSDPRAWKDIAGHKSEEFPKYAKFYKLDASRPDHIVNAPRTKHGQLRRQMANGFSDKEMRNQEPVIHQYIDLFISRLRDLCQSGTDPVDLGSWYNFTTFDLIGDLAFGEPFGCLEKSEYHPYVHAITGTVRAGTVMQFLSYYPLLRSLLMLFVPESMKKAHAENVAQAKAKLARRIEKGERPDLIDGLLRKKDDLNLDLDQLEANANILVIGGSETTATLLMGTTHLLLTNPACMEKLVQEVRSSFKSEAEIDITGVNKLTYMLACLDEAMRMYPPVAIGSPRSTPRGGGTVCGQYIPENTAVSVFQWATYHREKHFAKPFEFHPERFMNDPEFADDVREVLQPFNVGPRNCIGRNLAYTEMRLILARVIYNFDLKLAEESKDWMAKQKVYFLWNKGPLKVHLTPVRKSEKTA